MRCTYTAIMTTDRVLCGIKYIILENMYIKVIDYFHEIDEIK